MQEYVETAKKTITTATKKVMKKSSEIYEVTKLSLKISSLKNSVEEKYQKIGKIAYESYKGNDTATDEAEKIFAEIDEINEKINDLARELAIIKNSAICPLCGAEVTKDSTFCASCGEKI